MITIDTLINATIFSILLVVAVAVFIFVTSKTGPDLISSVLFSLATGLLIGACIVFFCKGFIPFFRGIHIPFKGILIIWPICSVILVPFVGYNVEITGNVVLDVLLSGGLLALWIAVMGTGYAVTLHQGCWGKVLQSMTFIGLFLGVIIRAIFWALE
ncbi:MAG: hypothetical protein WC614_10870 [bacterium]